MAADHTMTPDDILPDFEVFPSPIERFIMWRWFWLMIVAPYGALVALGALYALLDGTFPQLSFGWSDGILTGWFLPALLVPLSLSTAVYLRWGWSIPDMFRRLVTGKRLIPYGEADSLVEDMHTFTEEYRRLVFSRWRFVIIALTLAPWIPFIALTNPYARQFAPSGNILLDAIALLHITILYAVFPLAWDYFLGAGIWPLIATSITMRRLTRTFDLNIQPSHPDRSGGLRLLGEFCEQMALPVLIAVVVTSIFGIGGIVTGWIDRSQEIRVVLLLANFALAVGVVLAVVVFLWPLWNIHLHMLAHRRKYQDEFANRAATFETGIRDALDAGKLDEAKADGERLETLQALHPDKIGFPTWPFDQRVALRFLTPQLLPLVSLVLGGLNETIRSALLNVLSILFGGS